MISKHRISALLMICCVGCDARFREEPEHFTATELASRKAYDRAAISLSGQIVDEAGESLAGVRVRAGDETRTTSADGLFEFDGLARRNVLLEATKDGFYPSHVAIWLARGLEESAVRVDPVAMRSRAAQSVRLLFGGDAAFGRRYLDPSATTPLTEIPRDDPSARIRPSAAGSMTRDILAGVRPYFQAADYGTVNLESVVTETPQTPHPTKAYVYFSLPPSAEALSWLGVDYVSLGNNHVYDYLARGVQDTLEHVNAAGLQHSGLGATPDEAWAPFRVEVRGSPFSMVSACSIVGVKHEHHYVADETQGGAANLRDTARLEATLGGERAAGRLPIAMWHTGDEYTFAPTAYAKERMELAAEQGAALVLSHHAHVAMGFGRHAGVPIVFGLGNFAFDQDRLETMLGLLAQVDFSEREVVDIQGIPTQLESYRPLPVAGPLADALVRRITELSDGVAAYPYNHRAEVLAPGRASERDVVVEVEIPASGSIVVDLRELRRDGESLARAKGPFTARLGRPLMNHGSMEDYDVDNDALDAAHWDLSGDTRFVCRMGARRGAAGLCSMRSSSHESDTIIAFRNRVRVWGDFEDEPNKDVSLLGWVRGENAGPVAIVVRYYASEGGRTFGEERVFEHIGGDFEWTRIMVDLNIPEDVAPSAPEDNPRQLRFFMRQAPPAAGHGLAAWDDFALISWHEELELDEGVELPTPNTRDFIRLYGAPGPAELSLGFLRYLRE